MSFGKADHGKLGHGDAQVNRAIPTVVETMQGYNIVKVASMSTYAVVVDAEGRVFVWGTGKHSFGAVMSYSSSACRGLVGKYARASHGHCSSASRSLI